MFEAIKEQIAKAIKEAGLDKKKDWIIENLEEPRAELGDLALPFFKISEKPEEEAKKLAKSIKKPPLIRKIENAGPYLNFFLDYPAISLKIFQKIAAEEELGKAAVGKKALIDYCSANPAHALHLGSTRSLLLGESLARILQFRGWKVERIFYVNDLGKQTAQLFWGYEKEGKEPKGKPDHWLGKIYSKARQKAPTKEIEEILRKYEKSKGKWKKWKKVINLCLKGIRKSIDRFGIKFDQFIWESELLDESYQIVNELDERGYIYKHEGALITELGEAIPDTVILRSNGTGLYLTRDLALAFEKEKSSPDLNLYVIGEEQSTHFKQLFKTLELLDRRKLAEKSHHLAYGLVTIAGKKMSSRKGEAVWLDQLLLKGKQKAEKEVRKRWPELPKEEAEKRADYIACGALAYYALRYSPEKNIQFDWNEALQLEGETGPYLQYTYARACGILEKASKRGLNPFKALQKCDPLVLNQREERQLLKLLAKFPTAVKEAASKLRPHLLASYSYKLCELFNKFYHLRRVLQTSKKKREARLALVKAFKSVLARSLQLLVIEAPRKM